MRRPLVLGQVGDHRRGESAALLGALPPRVHLVDVDGQVGLGAPLGAALLAHDAALLLPVTLLALQLLLLFF